MKASAGVQMDHKRLEKPQLPEARICIWEDLTYSGMDVIEQAASMEELKLALSQLLCEPLQTCDPRGSILLDLYAYAVQFSRTHSFSKEQTSAFFSILRRLHRAATGTPLGNVDECCQYFKELLLCHAVRRPPFSIDLFSAEQVKLITEYVIDTYFRHFKLYTYVFTPQIRMDLSFTYLGMPDTPPAAEEEEPVVEEQRVEEEKEREELEVHAKEEDPQATGIRGDDLREYIEAQIAERVSELRVSLEGQLKVSERQLGSQLSALERPGFRQKASRGKK
ncbi:coiled-coil domain-containing protein 189 isoform X1 [Hypanus sabinus]|uniref:coiled-coil domain-containing protein 189 isoform X1 n=1 Tax=Hypanus sabinus TaxID=79690 RepID=UPI0028C4B818|nr:coiled-coil domain-containing protein 189 isoform X1 [Hypanus sabinus]